MGQADLYKRSGTGRFWTVWIEGAQELEVLATLKLGRGGGGDKKGPPFNKGVGQKKGLSCVWPGAWGRK